MIEEAFTDVDQSKVDALKDFAEEVKERLRGTVWEYEMLHGKGECVDDLPLAKDQGVFSTQRCINSKKKG